METSKGVWNTLLGPQAPCFSWLCDTSSLPHPLASFAARNQSHLLLGQQGFPVVLHYLEKQSHCSWDQSISTKLQESHFTGFSQPCNAQSLSLSWEARAGAVGSLPCVTQIAVWVRFCIWGSIHLCKVESSVKRGVQTHGEKTSHQTDCHFQAARKSSLIYNCAQGWQEQLKNSPGYREYDSSWTFLHSVLAQPICTTLQSLLQ